MNWPRIWRNTIAAGTLALLLLAGAAWFVAGALTAPAQCVVGPPPQGYEIDSVKIHSESGSDLAGWFMPCDGARATLILLHPIRTERRAMLGRAMRFHDAGYAVLLIDFQAHGESPGENITAGYRERLDAMAAVDFARAKNSAHRIGIVGWSLGGAAALLAGPLKIDALVLESVYPTISEAIENRVAMRLGPLSYILAPALLCQLQPRLGITPSQLRPIDHIHDIGCPVLVAAGDRDEHTTLPETKRLYEAAQEPKQLVIFTGAAHIDLLGYDPEKYSEIVAFLDAHLSENESERGIQ